MLRANKLTLPGRDVKPLSYTGPSSRTTEDIFSQATETKLWVLDFDQVEPITMDTNGVERAVDAATRNDPYLPKPLQTTVHEQEAWKAFVTVCLLFFRATGLLAGCETVAHLLAYTE